MTFSPDGQHYWDGTAWRPTSPDRAFLWDGVSWRPIPTSATLSEMLAPQDQAQHEAEAQSRRQAWTTWAQAHVPAAAREAAVNAAISAVARGQSSDEAARAALTAGWTYRKRWSRRTRILIAVGVAVVVALIGIGTGESIANHFSSNSQLAAAQSLVLKASDLPTGWDSAPDKSAGASAGLHFSKQFDQCLGTDTSVFDNNTVRARSGNFSMNNGATGISNTVYISTSAAAAEQIFEIAAGPKAPSCQHDLFQADLPSSSGYSTTNVTTNRLDISNYLAHTFAMRTTITLSNGPSDFSPSQSYDQIWMQVGRVNASFAFWDTDRVFDSSLEGQVIKTVAHRMAGWAGAKDSSTASESGTASVSTPTSSPTSTGGLGARQSPVLPAPGQAGASPSPSVGPTGTVLSLTANGAIHGNVSRTAVAFDYCGQLTSGGFLYRFPITAGTAHVHITVQAYSGDNGTSDAPPDVEVVDPALGVFVAVAPASTVQVASDGTSVMLSVDMVGRDNPGQKLHLSGSFECAPS